MGAESGEGVGSEEGGVPELDRRTSQVNFDMVAPEKTSRTKINREVTPFPKELHSKAMQWRAAREAAAAATAGEGRVQGEGAVMLRSKAAGRRRAQDRNSLLTALANPLNEVQQNLSITELTITNTSI